MPNSQNGYTVVSREDCKFYDNIVDGLSLPLRDDDCGYVLARFARKFNKQVELLNKTDTFGHSERKISGSTDWSNHASGTALDLNSTKHAYGKEDTFNRTALAHLLNLLSDFDAVIKWGGNYRVTKDEMHFEIDKPYDDVRRLAKVLRQKNTVRLDHLQKLGQSNIDVYMVKRALTKRNGESIDGLTQVFNKEFKQDYKQWQTFLGYEGKDANGIPGRASLEALGFKVRRN